MFHKQKGHEMPSTFESWGLRGLFVSPKIVINGPSETLQIVYNSNHFIVNKELDAYKNDPIPFRVQDHIGLKFKKAA